MALPATCGPSAPVHNLLNFAGMVQDELDGDGEDYIELPSFEFDNGLDSPHLYVHGVPFHNMVDEETRER